MTDTTPPDPDREVTSANSTQDPTAREPTEHDQPTGDEQAAENTENEPAG